MPGGRFSVKRRWDMAGRNSFKSCHKQIGKLGWLIGMESAR
jgi:hypothetical protein